MRIFFKLDESNSWYADKNRKKTLKTLGIQTEREDRMRGFILEKGSNFESVVYPHATYFGEVRRTVKKTTTGKEEIVLRHGIINYPKYKYWFISVSRPCPRMKNVYTTSKSILSLSTGCDHCNVQKYRLNHRLRPPRGLWRWNGRCVWRRVEGWQVGWESVLF